MTTINNFNPDLSYRIIEQELFTGIHYKIMQPYSYFIFWKIYRNVVKRRAYQYDEVIWFSNWNEVIDFIKDNQKKKIKPNNIVFDSSK